MVQTPHASSVVQTPHALIVIRSPCAHVLCFRMSMSFASVQVVLGGAACLCPLLLCPLLLQVVLDSQVARWCCVAALQVVLHRMSVYALHVCFVVHVFCGACCALCAQIPLVQCSEDSTQLN